MKSDRGAANIRKFNAERAEKNLTLVKHELQFCRKRKMAFRSPGILAAYLSDRTGIHRTTLIRNPQYRVLLTQFVGSQPGAASKVDDSTDDVYVLKAKLSSAQSEVGALRYEVKRLAALVERLSQMDASPGASDIEVGFANVCALLGLVLARGEVFAVDINKRTVLDLAARPSERIVAGPERAAPFISWIEKNEVLPLVKAIRKVKP